MNAVVIAKLIFAYSNWMNKARSKIENLILENSSNSNFKYYTLLLSETYDQTYYVINFRNKQLNYSQLTDQQKQNFNQMVQHILNGLQEKISSITNQLNEKTWILKNFINETYIPNQDDDKFEEDLMLFNRYKKKKQMVKRDIKQYKNYAELHQAVSKFLTMQDVFEFANKQCKKICSNGSFSCYRVDDFEQGKILFSQTGWCVKGRGYFQDYGAPYYLVFNGNKRYALIHLGSQQCKNLNDQAIDPGSAPQSFIKMLAVLFEHQNDENFLSQGDFEGYIPYYINNCIDYVDYFTSEICQYIDNQKFENIYYLLRNLINKNKLQSLLQENSNHIKLYLEHALQLGQDDDSDFIQVIQLLIAHEIKLQYPQNVFYIVIKQDNVQMFKKFYKCNETDDIPRFYDQQILYTFNILKHELENGYQISRFDIQQAKYVLQDFTDLIDSVDGAKKFCAMFYYDGAEQLKQLCQYIYDYLQITEQQKDYLQQYYKKVKQKQEFDAYPSLPGMQDF